MKYFTELQQALGRLDPAQLDRLLALVRDCQGTIWLAGNGGSASTAQHWACDLSKAAGRRAIALGSNPAVLTAWANDVSYEGALAAELGDHARSGDVLICLSCSGTSKNIAQVMKMAHLKGLASVLVTSDLYPFVATPLTVRVLSEHYGIIEDCHLSIGHWLTEELKRELC